MDQVKLPGIGPVDQKWVWAGGALIVGIVGWAYLHRPAPPVDPNASDALLAGSAEGVSDGTSSFTGPGGSTVLDGGGVDPSTQPPATNADWTRRVIDYLAGALGYDAPTVAEALGKYLARQPIAPGTEANVITAALAAWGAPPQGNFSVILQPPPVTPPPPATTPGLKYVVQVHQLGAATPARSLIQRFSSQSANGNQIEVALRRTVADPRNARYAVYYGRHGGSYPAQAKIYTTVVV